jgi:ParB family chromosome partitioning protein
VPRSSRAPVSLQAVSAVARAVPAVQDRHVYDVLVAEIAPSPHNPRQRLDGIEELAESIGAHGLLQPIVVRRVASGYQLVAGHRRLAAVQRLGWAMVPANVRDEDADGAYILTLVENLQREDLTPKEEAAALEVLVRERKWSTRQVGDAIKRSAMYVSRRLRVFDDPVLAPLVLTNQLPVSTAEELLRADEGDREALARQAIDECWERPQVRTALAERNAALQKPSSRLAGRIHSLAEELALVDPELVSPTIRRALVRLLKTAQPIARTSS